MERPETATNQGEPAINPDDRDPSKRDEAAGFDDAWSDILRVLQPLAPEPDPPPADLRDEPPDEAVPEPHAAGETLDELQALMRQHAAAARPVRRPPVEPAPPSEEDSWNDNRSRWMFLSQRLLTGWPLTAAILVGAAALATVLAMTLGPALESLVNAPEQPVEVSTAPIKDASRPTMTLFSEAAPLAIGATDRGALEKAMKDCDAEAASHPDAIYFLIVPLVSPGKDTPFWTPLSVGDIGASIILLRSKDAMDGLSSGRLAVNSEPFRFFILDANTNVASKWPPVAGPARLIKPNASTVVFQVGFGFADPAGDAVSSFTFPRKKGECYWVSALRRN